MPKHLKILLLLEAVLSPIDAWKHRGSFLTEWDRARW